MIVILVEKGICCGLFLLIVGRIWGLFSCWGGGGGKLSNVDLWYLIDYLVYIV